MLDGYCASRAYQELYALRIPGGWRVDWNTLSKTPDGDTGSADASAVFLATNEGRRFQIDVERRRDTRGVARFQMTVSYQPWARSPSGRRVTNSRLQFDAHAEVVHSAQISSAGDLVQELETWIARCTMWVREGH